MSFLQKMGINKKLINDQAENIRKMSMELSFSETTFLAVYKLSNGMIDYTGSGQAKHDEINTAPQFERVLLGKEVPIAEWEDSFTLVQDPDDHKIRVIPKVGRYIKAFGTEMTLRQEQQQLEGQEEYSVITDRESISLILPDYETHPEDIYKYYKVMPKSNRMFRIDTANNYYDTDGKIAYSEWNLVSVELNTFNSAQATNVMLQTHSLGGRSTLPFLDYENRKLTYKVQEHKGITSIQIETLGDCIMAGIGAFGRPKQADGTIVEPRLLLPQRIIRHTPTEIVKSQPANMSYGLLGMGRVQFNLYYGDWLKEVELHANKETRNRYEGVYEFGYWNGEHTNFPNAGENYINRKRPLWDPSQTIGHALTYNAVGNDYLRPTRTGTHTEEPHEKFDEWYVLDHSASVAELLGTGLLALKDTPVLQIQIDHLTTFNAKSIPVLGGIINKLSFGIPWGSTDDNIHHKINRVISGVCNPSNRDIALATRYKNADAEKRAWIPLEFYDNTDEAIGKVASIASVKNVFKLELTDTFTDKDGNSHNTKDLGDIWFFTDDADGSHSRNKKPANPSESLGFELDNIMFMCAGKFDYIVSAYAGENRVFTGRYSSMSKFIDNNRAIGNIITTSNLTTKNIEGFSQDWRVPTHSNLPVEYKHKLREVEDKGGYDNYKYTFDPRISTSIYENHSKVEISINDNWDTGEQGTFSVYNGDIPTTAITGDTGGITYDIQPFTKEATGRYYFGVSTITNKFVGKQLRSPDPVLILRFYD